MVFFFWFGVFSLRVSDSLSLFPRDAWIFALYAALHSSASAVRWVGVLPWKTEGWYVFVAEEGMVEEGLLTRFAQDEIRLGSVFCGFSGNVLRGVESSLQWCE